MSRMVRDRRGVTSLEYALVAGAIALVLFEVLQVPANDISEFVGRLLAAWGGHSPSG